MAELKILLNNYAKLLTSSWGMVEFASKLENLGSIKIDWLQASWEILVEGLTTEPEVILEVYGEGADCNGASSRILFPELVPTHKIICMPLEEVNVYDMLNKQDLDVSLHDIVFVQFVSMGDDGWYYERPNFDCVLAEYNGNQVVVNFEKTDFKLKNI